MFFGWKCFKGFLFNTYSSKIATAKVLRGKQTENLISIFWKQKMMPLFRSINSSSAAAGDGMENGSFVGAGACGSPGSKKKLTCKSTIPSAVI